MAKTQSPGNSADFQVAPSSRAKYAVPGIVAAIVVALIILALPTPEGLSVEGKRMAALFAVALILFVTEAIPLAVTSVLVLMLQPIMGITGSIIDAFNSWVSPVFFFVLVMFIIAQAVSVTGLAKRFALWLLSLAGTDSRRVIMVFVIGTGLMSLTMSDVPACAIFMAIGLGMIDKMGLKPGSSFAKALMIGIPIGALIGGVGTPAGSSINLLGLDQLREFGGIDVGYVHWMAIGMPMVIILLPLAAWIISRFYTPEIATIGSAGDIEKERSEMGPMSAAEIKVVLTVGVMVVLWILSTWVDSLDVYSIGIGGAVVMFLPGFKILNWKQAQAGTGWDALMLVGGVTSLGRASVETGLAQWMVDSSLGGIADMNPVWVIAMISAFTVVIHLALPINPVIVTVLIPPLAILAMETGVNPALYALPVAFTASCAFLLPIDAVPLLTYGKGYYKMLDMLPPGLVLSVIWVILMTALLAIVGPFLGYL
jgi:sodium-dependent dicarboxylate transporter 2/3/5